MRKNFITLVVLLAVCTTAHARLGETPDELFARFGKTNTPNLPGLIPRLIFAKNNICISCDIVNGHSVREVYAPNWTSMLLWLDNAHAPTPRMRDLLEANAQGQTWKQTSFVNPNMDVQVLVWTRTDGTTATTDGVNLTFVMPEYTAEVQRRADAAAAA